MGWQGLDSERVAQYRGFHLNLDHLRGIAILAPLALALNQHWQGLAGIWQNSVGASIRASAYSNECEACYPWLIVLCARQLGEHQQVTRACGIVVLFVKVRAQHSVR